MFRSSAIQNIQLGLFLILATVTSFCYAGNYTWNGNTSTAWTTSSNWTPSGVPGSTDTVTIVTGSRNVYLAANTSVKQLTMTSGTIDLQTYTLSVSATGMFTSGQINNGTLSLYGTSTITFKGTTFGAVVSATGNSILLNGSTFNDSLSVVKKGTAGDNGKGGNTFNGAVSIIDSASGNLVLSDSFPDVFNSRTWVTNRSTGKIYIAHRGTSNQFNGDVTFAGKNIWSNYYGTASYNGNITFDTPNGEVYFGYSTGNCSLSSGKNLFIGTNGFSAGFLYLRNFVQSDSTISVSLTLTGTAKIAFESGTSIKANVAASAPFIYLEGTRFLGTCSITTTGSSNITSLGGSYFAKATTIFHNPSAACTFTSGSTSVDTFASPVILKNGIGTMSINNSLFLDSVSFKNLNSVTGSDRYYVANTGNARMKGKVVFDNALAGMNFGNSGGTTTLDSTATTSVVSGFTGNLTLKNFIQRGSNAVFITMNNNSTKIILNSGTSFDGSFTYYGQYIQLNGATFNSTTNITRYGTSNDISNGGNVFNGTTILKDSSSHSNNFYLAYVNPDDYNADVSFIQKGSGVNIYPAYTANSTFAEDIFNESSNSIYFGNNGGCAVIDGTALQEINSTSVLEFKKVKVNKLSGKWSLKAPLNISDSLFLTNGIVLADSTNKFVLGSSSNCNGGSDSSFVEGPFSKTGSSSFSFPVGKDNFIRPIALDSISSSSTFTAQYFHSSPVVKYGASTKDSTLGYISECEYWTLNQSGTSSCYVDVYWDITKTSCGISASANLKVARWNGSSWKDEGNSSYSGDSINGHLRSRYQSSVGSFSIGNSVNSGLPPSGIIANFPRAMFLDKVFSVFRNSSNQPAVDVSYGFLGTGTINTSTNLYPKEQAILEYCQANHVTHLVMYNLGVLFDNSQIHYPNTSLNPDVVVDNLCRFMNVAKNDYCIETFGAAVSNTTEFNGIMNYNNSLTLSSLERALINDTILINAIEDSTILASDSLFDITQLLRLSINISRFNIGPCADFDIFTTEYEYWNLEGDFQYYKDFVDILSAAHVKIEAYTSRLYNYADPSTDPNCILDYNDGNNAGYTDPCTSTTLNRKVDQILAVNYSCYNATVTKPFDNGVEILNNYFNKVSTQDWTVFHPLHSAEGGGLGGVNYQGLWMSNPYVSGVTTGTTPGIARNIFTVEKLYYDDWRTNSHVATNINNAAENIIHPGSHYWFTSSILTKYFNNPAIIYRIDQTPCVASGNLATVKFKYCGPVESNIDYTFDFVHSDGITAVTGISISSTGNSLTDISLNDYSTNPSPNAVDDLIISSVPYLSGDYYIAKMHLNYYNHDRSIQCGSYTYEQKVYVSDVPQIIWSGSNGQIVCEEDPIVLYASVNVTSPQTITWYRRPHAGGSGTAFSHGNQQYLVLNYADNASMIGNWDIYYVISDPSANSHCSSLTSDPVNIIISANTIVNITSNCVSDPGNQNVILSTDATGPSLSYLWSDGSTSQSMIAYYTDRYSVTVTNSAGCSREASINIPGIPTFDPVPAPVACNYTITESGYGSTHNGNFNWYKFNPATHAWTHLTGNNSSISVGPGYYSCVITIGSLCRANQIAVGPTITNSVVTMPSCNPHADGQIALTPGPGTTPSYSWSTTPTQTTATATSLSSGVYTVTLSDGTCTSTVSFTLTNTVTVTVATSASQNVSCNSGVNGSATINASGGASPYSYSWSPSGGTAATTSGLVAGTYTCTVTDVNGCVGTTTVTISQPAALSLSMSHNDCTCNGQSNGDAQLSVSGGMSPYSYNWSPVTGTTNSISGLTAGTYSCTVTDQNSCTSTSSVVIASPSALSLSMSTPDPVCVSGTDGTLTLSVSGGTPSYNYSWSPSGGTSSTASGLAAGTYTCTVTDNHSCTSTSSSTISLNQFCCGSASSQMLSSAGVLTSGVYSSPTNQSLSFNAVISSGTVEFSGLDILIAEAVSITVQAGCTLKVTNNSILHACGNMWAGIIVESGGTLIIEDGSTIEDAEFGATLLSGANLSTNDAEFNRDYVGIYVPEAVSGMNSVNMLLNKTRFSCSSALTGKYTSQATDPATRSLSGIFVNDLALLDLQGTVGGTLADQIYFSNLNFGILAHNSNLNLENEIRFENIKNFDNSYKTLIIDRYSLGSSIYSESTTGAELLVVLNNPYFLSDMNGISTFRVNAQIEGNTFGSVSASFRSGIRITNSTNLNVQILNNNIKARYIGIDLNLNDQAQKLYVYGNNINMTNGNNQSIGINAMDGGLASNYSTISHNIINMGSSPFNSRGIVVNNCNSYKVASNDIYLPASILSTSDGILLSGCSNLTLTCNYVQGTNSSLSHSSQYGIHTSFSQGADYFYKCNTVGHTYDGFYFEGPNLGMWESNSMFTDAFGLHITGTGLIGNQIHEGNLWRGAYGILGAKNENIQGIGNNQFIVDPTYQYHLPNTFDPPGMFTSLSGIDASCSSSDIDFPEYCMDPVIISNPNGRISSSDIMVALDSIHSSANDSQMVWYSRKKLMQKILFDTTLTSEDSSIASFFNNNKFNLLSQLSYINILKDSLTWIDSISTLANSVKIDSIKFMFDEISYFDSLIVNDSTLDLETIGDLYLQKDSVSRLLIEQANKDREELAIMTSILNSRVSELLDINDTLSSMDKFVQNEIDVNHLYLSNVSLNEWDNIYSDSVSIYNIASKCPLSEGPSVYGARSIFHFINDDEIYNDDLICGSPDTCSILDRPGLVSGDPNFGVCEQTYQYSIPSMSGATFGYRWEIPSGASFVGDSTTNTILVSFPVDIQSGLICVHGVNACGDGLDRCMAVFGAPKPVEDISGNSSVCENDVEVYTWNSVPGSTEYNIILPDGATCLTSNPTITNSVVVEFGSAGGAISIIASNNCGNSDTTSLAVEISCRTSNQNLYNVSQENLPRIFPNPTYGTTTLVYSISNDRGYLQIVDLFGEVIKLIELDGTASSLKFDISELAPQVVGYRLIDGDRIVNCGKIVIIR